MNTDFPEFRLLFSVEKLMTASVPIQELLQIYMSDII